MELKVMLDPGAIMPTRAHESDAGLDLYTPVYVRVPGSSCNDYCGWCSTGAVVVDTGVHVQIPHGYVGLLKSKSGLNVKFGITGEGVIDSGYTGSIKAKLYNHEETALDFNAGEKIIQLVIVPCELPTLVQVDALDDTERGAGGFGSTGR